jgi:uncharacterized protein with HEPN domain
MYDRELCLEVLYQIQDAAEKVVSRFEAIHKASDFTYSSAGMEKMDAICMMLIVIGESLKNSTNSLMVIFCDNTRKLIGEKQKECAT